MINAIIQIHSTVCSCPSVITVTLKRLMRSMHTPPAGSIAVIYVCLTIMIEAWSTLARIYSNTIYASTMSTAGLIYTFITIFAALISINLSIAQSTRALQTPAMKSDFGSYPTPHETSVLQRAFGSSQASKGDSS